MKPEHHINKAMPRNMILGQLITNEIKDQQVLQAMADVPRELFVPNDIQGAAYVDEDMHIGKGRFLPAPLTCARLLQYAEITPNCRVLLVGCTTGYLAALLARLAGHVVGIESDAAFIESTRRNLQDLGLSGIDVEPVKSLAEGYALSAPYDAIIIAGAVDFIPDALASQLSLHGRLTAIRRVAKRPGMEGGLGKGILIKRIGTQLHYRELFDDATPLLPGFAQEERFTF